jgi:hypothetical protein
MRVSFELTLIQINLRSFSTPLLIHMRSSLLGLSQSMLSEQLILIPRNEAMHCSVPLRKIFTNVLSYAVFPFIFV